MKRVLTSVPVRRVLCRLGAAYIRFVKASSRWQTEGFETPQRLWQAGQPFIGAFWHGRMLMIRYMWTSERPVAMLISRHADGRFIAETIRHFGVSAIAGSSSHGGSEALRQMVRALKAGTSVGITPDGPRGPRMRAAPGAVQAARLAGVPLVPGAVATSRRRVLGSWDRFVVALPFSRGAFVWGEPIHVPADADAARMEQIRRQLEDALNEVTQRADRIVGQVPIEPATALADNHAE